MSSTLALGKRFADDGSAVTPMNELQCQAKLRLQSKMTQEYYKVRDLHCLCGKSTDDAMLLSEKDRYGIPIKVWLCKACALIYVSPYFDDSSVLKFYAEDYRDIYEGDEEPTERFFLSQYRTGQEIMTFVQKKIPSFHELAVLDIGCGAGGILKAFQDQGARCTGCDLDPRYVGYGRSKGVDILQGDFLSIAGMPNRFDLVLVTHVLEHLTDPRRALREIRQLLKPGGFVYVEVPNVVPQIALMGQLQNAHVWYFDVASLDRLLRECGLQIVHAATPYHLQTLSVACPEFHSVPVGPAVFRRRWPVLWIMERIRSVKHAIGNILQRFGLKEAVRSLALRKAPEKESL